VIEKVLDQFIPAFTTLRVDHVPLSRYLREPVLLVAVVHVVRPRLDVVIVVHGFEQSVEVRDGAKAHVDRLRGVHFSYHELREMRRAAHLTMRPARPAGC